MRPGFDALRDDGIHTRLFQLARFFYCRRGAKNDDASRFDTRYGVAIGNAKGEAEDGRVSLEHGFELRGEWIGRGCWRDGRGNPKLFVHFSEEFQHGTGVERLRYYLAHPRRDSH